MTSAMPYHTMGVLPSTQPVATLGSVWYGMVDACDGYLAAEASGSSFG